MFRFRRRRSRVRIGQVRDESGPAVTSGRLYEIIPESYAGPWILAPGTVLEVVNNPAKGEGS